MWIRLLKCHLPRLVLLMPCVLAPLPPIDRLGFPRAGATILEQTSYRQAVMHPEWQFAMAVELAALERIGTWDHISAFPPHARSITCKWIYKVKALIVSLERYKAHIVV